MLAKTYWTIADRPVDMADWSANCVLGGYEQMDGVIPPAQARAHRDSFAQGAVVKGFLDSGTLFWEGRLSLDPYIRSDGAQVGAAGHKERLDNEHGRLLYQSRDYSLWQDASDDPMNFAAVEEIEAEVRQATLFFRTLKGEAYGSNEQHQLAAWVPGATISRYAFTIVKNRDAGNFDIRADRFTGPSGTATNIADHNLGAAQPTTIAQTIGTPQDALKLSLRCNTGTTPPATNVIRLANLRINGIASGDTYSVGSVLGDLASRVGYQTDISAGLGINALPLDWQEGSWAELADYVVMLVDAWWRVLDDRGSGPYLEAKTWSESRAWTALQSHGAQLDMAPLELFNRVVVRYEATSGIEREVTVNASPDPLAPTGQVNVFEESLEDPQPDTVLATAVANALIARLSQPRFAGRIDVTSARDTSGVDAPYEIRAGDVVTVTDWDMATSKQLPIYEVEYSPEGVSLGIESEVSATRIIALAALEGARRTAPSRRRRRR